MLHFPRWQIIAIVVLCLLTPLFILPNFQSVRDYVPFGNKINLGLDLQGGVHLAYQADTEQYYKNRLQTLKNDIRGVLRPARSANKELIGYRNFVMRGHSLSFMIVKPEQTTEAMNRLEDLNGTLEGSSAKEYTITANNNIIKMVFTDAHEKALTKSLLNQTIEVMRRRIDAFGTREPNILRQGNDKIILQVPGESDVNRLKSEVGKTAQMTFHLVLDNPSQASKINPPLILPMEETPTEVLSLEADAIITGDNLVNASLSRDNNGMPAVSFKFDSKGSQKFGQITADNIGRLFAIVLDNNIISAPRIQSAIFGGSGIISGNFTTESAGNLALLLRSGALPVDLKIIEERIIGPELGAESIVAGAKSLVYGFLAVSAFMIVFYGLSGVFSVVALIVNTLMVFAILSMISATLTLPGIAGIVLGMGVAVDANVLINERIREELRHGHSVIKSVTIGYDKAWVTILDSHITGMLSAFVMFFLGSGPIRGFAVTLGVGILLSLFTSVWISRLLFSHYILTKKPEKLRFGLSGA
jgi:protein-export membrane protein SecD